MCNIILQSFKVACVVNIKIFKDCFYYGLIILITQCETPYKNLDKTIIQVKITTFRHIHFYVLFEV